jgi:hypothetical protein
LITVAPRSTARAIASASVLVLPNPVDTAFGSSALSEPAPAGPNTPLFCRIDRIVASGAIPAKLSSSEGAAAMIPATTVPCASQSCSPSLLDT